MYEKDFGLERQGSTSEADGERDLRCGLLGIWEMEVVRLQRVIQIAGKQKDLVQSKEQQYFSNE